MTNLLLQDPFSVLKEYPDKLTYNLENPFHTECVRFSPRGDYLALGCSNGSVVIYDMDTFRPICVLGILMGAHTRSVQSISWSPGGRYLLTGARDRTVKLWDLAEAGRPLKEARFDSPIWNCQWVDAEQWFCIVTALEESSAFLIDFGGNESQIRPLNVKVGEQDQGYVLTSAVHTKFSDVVFTATSRGWINAYRLSFSSGVEGAKDAHLLSSVKVANGNIKHVIVSQNGDKIAVNCSDRTIRQYALSLTADRSVVDIELEHKYQDVINKLQWNSISFSNKSAEYLVASTHGSSAHELYLWETSSGTLVRVLEGAEEELMDIDWNFFKMFIASNGLESGNVHIWSIVIAPKWSALAPDFEEVEENVEYQEKEDEFDQIDELEQQQELNQAEEVNIDLRTKEQFDVRGNDLLVPQFNIPTDYERILTLKAAKVGLP
ncbi:SWD1 (YAR003W) [Zygosaccharomyces parabailii]|nr:SWD1 (YAR003W) [Zygosaccharomyces parabailii]